MKTIKSCLSVLFVAASSLAFAETEVLATFHGFDTLTSGDYTADIGNNAMADGKVTIGSHSIKLTSSTTWDAQQDGISLLVKYSGYAKPSADAVLISLKSSAFGGGKSGIGTYVKTSDGTVHGFCNGTIWGNETAQVNDQTVSASGYLVLTYFGDTTLGTVMYDGSGNVLYQAKGLSSSSSQQVGDILTIGAKYDNNMKASGMVIEGAQVFKGVLAQSEITAAVKAFDDDEEHNQTLELTHAYSFDGNFDTDYSPLTFAGATSSFVDSGHGKAYKISASAKPYGEGISIASDSAWTIATFAKMIKTDKAVVWAMGRIGQTKAFALTTGTNGYVQIVANESIDGACEPLVTSEIQVADLAEKYHLYTITSTDKFLRLYVDGTLAGVCAGGCSLPDERFQFGQIRGGNGSTGLTEGYDSEIDEWRMYHGAMSSEQVQKLAQEFPVWPNDNGAETVSINFIGGSSNKNYRNGQSITDQETAGVVEVAGCDWNQLLDKGGVVINTNSVPLKEVLKNGATVTGVMTADIKAKCTWNALGNSVPVSGNGRMMYGYLDDGETSDGYGAQVTINNIPYSEYTVYVYMGSDATGSYFCPVYVNGILCPLSAYNWYGHRFWGGVDSTHETDYSTVSLTENGNYIKLTSQTNSTLLIQGSTKDSYLSFRCGISAVQVVNTGTRQTTGGEYVADITATPANWNGGNGAGLAKHGGDWENDNTAAITLTNLTDDATLTFYTAVEAAKVNIVQAADKELMLKATTSMTVGAYDVSKSAGKVSFDGSTLGSSIALSGTSAKIIPGGTVEFALGENGTMSVSGNGSANSANIKYLLSSGTLTMGASGSTGPFNKSPLTVSGAGTILKFTGVDATGYGSMTNPAFTIEDGAELQVGKRDTLTTPINLKSGTVRMMNGCADNGRGLELFNSYGNNWTIEGSSGFVLDSTIGEAGKRVWLHQGAWNVDVADGGIFNVDVILYGDNNIVKTGAGEMRINGVNEYTGTTTISAGRVYAGNPKALGTGAITIAEGAVLEFDLDDFVTITGSVAPFNFADSDSWSRVQANPSESHPEITYDKTTGKVKLDVSGSGVTGLHISSINPKPKAFDPNGHESSIVYLTNYGPEPVNLKDYKLVRTNFGKEASPDDIISKKGKVTKAVKPLLDYVVDSGDTYAVYFSEDYETAEDFGGDGITVQWFGTAMVVPTKINPKKYPMVRLYNFASETNVIDEVIVPCEIDDDITVEVGLNTNKLVRYVVNGTTRTEIGPDANGPYGVKDLENDIELMNGRGSFVPTTNGFTVTLPVNPLKTGDTVLDANKIKGVRLEYRFFDKTSMTSSFADMTKLTEGDAGYDKSYGDQWSYTIPQSELADKAGKLLQYRAIITDNGDAMWTAPRFCHPELGYEWYGAVVDPGEAVRTENLPTMLMFADSVNLSQMDMDVNNQDKSQVPYNARIAIYDTSTHRYYDNVRIDLRGNTSANFVKKSHGLRFSKVAPFTTTNPLDGKEWEVRKSSFCTEYADPTYIRQSLSFWLLNKVGSPAPFHYPVRLYLNGAFYQLAFHTERFTDELIEDVYGLNKFVYSYKNIGTFGGGTTGGGIEKKTPDDDNESDLSVLNPYCRRLSDTANGASMTDAQKAAVTKTVVTNFDLSAWINYIAIAKITHENDDVWANLSGYINKYDALHNPDGNDLMAPLAYDMNLSFGQWYYGDDSGAGRCGVRPADDQFKSHPLYGGFTIRAHKVNGSEVGNGNRAFEAVFQNEKFRRLYLRRLRTLMDEVLKEPGTAKEDTPFWTDYVEPFKALITASGKDVDDDRTKWNYANVTSSAGAIWVWDHALTLDEGYDDLWNNYIEPRRQHLFGKHAETNTAVATGYGKDLKAGIPAKQSAIADLKSKIGYALVDGGIKITNTNGETVDISGWQLGGPFTATIPNGTVLDENGGEVYFVTNRIAWCQGHASGIVDQFIVGNVKAGKPEADVSLIATDGTDIFYVPPTNQEHLRFLEVYGSTNDGAKGDTGEYFVLTNVSTELTVSLKGLQIFIGKTEDCEASGPEAAKMKLTLADGEVGPNGAATFLQSDYTKDDGWEKITNGDLYLLLRTSAGANAQKGYTSNKLYPECDGGGASLIAKTFGTTIQATTNDWRSSFEEPEPPEPEASVITGEISVATSLAGTAYTISNATLSATLTFTNPEGVTLTLAGDSMGSGKGQIVAQGPLTLLGNGSLSLTGETELMEVGGLTVNGGTLDLTTSRKKKIRTVVMHGNYYQNGGTVNLNVTGKADDKNALGFVWENETNAVYTAQLEGDAVFNATMISPKKSAAFRSENSGVVVSIGGDAKVTGDFSGVSGHVVDTDADIEIKGGAKVTVTSTATGGSVFEAVNITIKKSTIDVSATGAGAEIFSAADTIKIDNDKAVLTLVSDDDCFSAQTNIAVKAKTITATSLSNDVFDSNGSITVTAGTILAYTQAVEEDGIGSTGFDTNGGAFNVNGGTVVSMGGPNSHPPAGTGSQTVWTKTDLIGAACSNATVDVAGTSVTLPAITAESVSLQFSAPNLTAFPTIPGAEKTPVAPGEEPEMEAKTKEEAEQEIKKYKAEPTEEDKAAGVPQDALKMEAVAVTNETGVVTGYKAVVAVNPEVVQEPSVGGDENIDPIVITPDGEGKTEVSVGIVNATLGLWYGYEICNALGDGFANDVPSFKRATGESISVTGSKRSGNAAFFRVKVLPAKPTK